MEDVDIFYSYLIHLVSIWHILKTFSLFFGHLEYSPPPPFWLLHQEKSGNPGGGIEPKVVEHERIRATPTANHDGDRGKDLPCDQKKSGEGLDVEKD
jgi:hypothetical protein